MKKVAITSIALLAPLEATANGLVISPAEFEGAWPFKAETIELHCGLWENRPHVVFVANGRLYPLDNAALVTSWENGFSPLHQALETVPQTRSGQQDADREGLVLLEPLAERARALCPEKQE